MRRNWSRVLVASAVVAMLGGCGKREERPPPRTSPLPQPVVKNAETNLAAPEKPVLPEMPKMPVLPEMVATIQGGDGISVTAPQSGYLVRQVYKDGAIVSAGDVLFMLDTRVTHEGTPADKSALVRITSPIAGVPGDAWHGAGDRIEAGMELVDVAQIDEVDAVVTLPPALAKQIIDYCNQLEAVHAPSMPTMELVLPGGSVYEKKGTLGTMPSSGTIYVLSISFPNPKHILQPGELVKVRSATP
jgi:hypothetical protein